MKRVTAAIVAIIALLSLVAVAAGKTTGKSRSTGPTKLTSGRLERRELKGSRASSRSTTRPSGRDRERRSAVSTTTRSRLRSGAAMSQTFVSSFTAANVGNYCSSGGWIDLAPLPEQEPPQCQRVPEDVPVLHAVQGKALRVAAAGGHVRALLQHEAARGRRHQVASEELPELTADAKKLTQKNPRRKHQGARLQPGARLLRRNTPDMDTYAPLFGAKYTDAKGQVGDLRRIRLGRSSSSAEVARDYYGYKNLVKFQAGAGDEFSAQNAFERARSRWQQDVSGGSPSSPTSIRSCSTALRRCRRTSRASTVRAP